jgi:uncharacterized protein YbcI
VRQRTSPPRIDPALSYEPFHYESGEVALAGLPAVATSEEADNGSGGILLALSNAIVHIYKEAFGRGPTKARAQFAGSDTLVVLLEDSMTVAERNLAAMGEHDRLREARVFFQHAIEDEFRAVVQRILGRRTLAFASGIDTRRDVSVQVFTLAPRDG